MRDKHDIKFVENIAYTEDDGLFANWSMHFYRQTTVPSFPDLPSVRINAEKSTINNNNSALNQKDNTLAANDQETSSLKNDDDCAEVSPKRAKLR